MPMNAIIYSNIFIFSAFISLIVSIYVLSHTRYTVYKSITALMFAITIWSIFYGMELRANNYEILIMFVKLQYWGIVSIPVIWLIFASRYTGKDAWINVFSISALFVVPAVNLFMVNTNISHQLFYTSSSILSTKFGFIHQFASGPFYWIHIIYSYFLISIGIILVIVNYLHSSKIQRKRAAFVIFGSVIPFVFSAFYIIGFRPIGFIDLTPIGFMIMGLVVIYGVKNSKIFDIKPLLLNSLFDSLPDAIFALDTKQRIITANPKAMDMIEKKLITEDDFLEMVRSGNFIYNSESDLYFIEICISNQKYRIERTEILDKRKTLIGFLYIVVNITQEELYREALKKSEEQYKLLFDNVQEGIIVIQDERLVFFNPMFQKFSGYDNEELLALSVERFIFDTDRTYIMNLYKQFMMDQTDFNQKYSFRLKTKDNSICWVEFSSVPIVWNGKSAGLLFLNNINEKKLTEELKELLISISNNYINASVDLLEETIKNSLEEIGRFVNADRSYVFEYDWFANECNNTFEWCNEGIDSEIENLQNVSTDLIPQWVTTHQMNKPMFVDKVSDLEIDDPLRQILEPQGIKSLITIPMIDGDKCVGFVGFDSVVNYHIYSEKEKVLLKVFAQMIVNLKNRWLSNELLKSQISLQKLVNEISSDMISADNNNIDTKIKSMLQKTGEFFNVDRTYLLRYNEDRQLENNTHEWCANNINSEKDSITNIDINKFPWWKQQVLSKSIIHIDDTSTLSDYAKIEKTEFERQGIKTLICFPITNNGNLVGYFGFDSVKSHRKWKDNHKDIIIVLTNILGDTLIRVETEIELIRSKEMAEAASVAKSNFLSNMSHEIRTPLNGVIGFTELLRTTKLTNNQKEYLDNAINSANSLLGVISDILDFSKIESGKLEIESVKTDIIQLFENSSDIIKVLASNKGLELLLNIDPAIPRFAYIDPIRIKQILVNLLSNAVKFTHIGEIELRVSFSSKSNNRGVFNISVRDTGIGIKEEDKHKLFKAFSQADTSTTRRYGGTGLGLIISNSLAAKMGSRIGFESEYGKGTAFYFDLESQIEYGEPSIKNNFENIHNILVIDDNANNRQILEHTFRYWKIKCETVESGIDALGLMRKGKRYDLIIVDYHMPEMDGIDTIKNIRKEIEKNETLQPIIMLYSSSDELKIHELAKELNVSYQLTKPVKQDELLYYLNGLSVQDEKKYTDSSVKTETQSILKVKDDICILVAEDTPMNMLVIGNMLKISMPGVKLLEAKNGIEAIQIIKNHKPDLVLMDVQMPELDGLEATRQIRKLKNGLTIPIIALTAGVSKEEREICFKSGMDDFLSKPIDTKELKLILKKYIEISDIRKDVVENPDLLNIDCKYFEKEKLFSKIGNNEVMMSIMDMSKTEFPKYISEIETAILSNDIAHIKLTTHKLKGSALNMEFAKLAEVCKLIESNLEDKNLVSNYLIVLKDSWLETLNEINQ